MEYSIQYLVVRLRACGTGEGEKRLPYGFRADLFLGTAESYVLENLNVDRLLEVDERLDLVLEGMCRTLRSTTRPSRSWLWSRKRWPRWKG